MNNLEQTLSIIKPDAVERNLENEIKEMFKDKGFLIVKEKKIQIDKSEAEKQMKSIVKEYMINKSIKSDGIDSSKTRLKKKNIKDI